MYNLPMVLHEVQMDHPESMGVEFAKIIDILTRPKTSESEEQSAIWVATSDKQGNPHVVPLWYIVEDGTMYATCNSGSRVGRNLLSNNHLTATMSQQAIRSSDSDIKIVVTADATIGVDIGGRWKQKISERYLPAEDAKKRGDRGVTDPEVLIAIPINLDTVEGFTFPKHK